MKKEIMNCCAGSETDGIIACRVIRAVITRDVITTVAARHRLPAIYVDRFASQRGRG